VVVGGMYRQHRKPSAQLGAAVTLEAAKTALVLSYEAEAKRGVHFLGVIGPDRFREAMNNTRNTRTQHSRISTIELAPSSRASFDEAVEKLALVAIG